MKAKIRPRINLKDRTRLETVIPLSTPYLVFLDPSDKCNFQCRFCPTGSGEAKKYKKPMLMDFDLYKKIISDLCEMPEPIKTLRLYSDGEPFLNPKFPEMVKYAEDTNRFGQIDTTTNGSLLTPKTSQEIVDAGLDKIFVSVPEDYDLVYIKGVTFLYNYGHKKESCKVYVKIIGDRLNEKRRSQFIQDFSNFSDYIFIEHLAPCWPEFEVRDVNKNVGIYGQSIGKEVNICPYCFYSLKINSDGSVSRCFLDWKHKYVIGDLKTEKITDIWNKQMRHFQKLMLKDRKSIRGCSDCGQLLYGAPDNIDQYAEELLKRIK